MMKVLKEILPDTLEILALEGSKDVPVESLSIDSRTVKKGALFFAMKGVTSDGHNFIQQAIDNGASCILCETLPDQLCDRVCYIQVKNCSHAAGVISSAFYGDPSSRLTLVGVTGTNGKTTTVTLLYNLFMQSGFKTGLLSTVVNRVDEMTFPSTHTTPDQIRINELLAKMVSAGCTHCFMEVSSHAIVQNRIAGLKFKGGIFTNLTHDHLDYHGSFDEYLKAKKRFFDHLGRDSFALVNKDDRNGLVMVQNTEAVIYTYSLHSMADFRCKIIENQFQGLQLDLNGTECWFKLVGEFNAYNLLVVFAVAQLLEQEKGKALTIISALDPVDGRFNTLHFPNGKTAIVDYAHTPDALQNVLTTIQAIRSHSEQLLTVVGAGGNRDVSKRPLMAAIACSLSDRVILTSDNPRFEEPGKILEDMKKGVEINDRNKVLVIENREEAIRTACALMKTGDILLVAGKGHETYQEIKGVKYPFDDKTVLRNAFMINEPKQVTEN